MRWIKRKYLLNSLFDLEHFPTEDPASTEDDDFAYETMKRKYQKGGTHTGDTLNKLAALNELCASVLYPPSWPLLCLSSQRRSILQGNYSRPDIPASSKQLFRPKLQRQNAIIDKTMRDLSQKRVFTPLNEQIDRYWCHFLFQFMKPMITSMQFSFYIVMYAPICVNELNCFSQE